MANVVALGEKRPIAGDTFDAHDAVGDESGTLSIHYYVPPTHVRQIVRDQYPVAVTHSGQHALTGNSKPVPGPIAPPLLKQRRQYLLVIQNKSFLLQGQTRKVHQKRLLTTGDSGEVGHVYGFFYGENS